MLGCLRSTECNCKTVHKKAVQSLLVLRGKVKEPWLIHIVSIRRPRQSRDTYLILQTLLIFNRAEIVHWVLESNRPFKIVEDRGFLNLMKTGQPGYYIPLATTVSQDVKLVFGRTRERIAKVLKVLLAHQKERKELTIYQEYDGLINLITDCWTSPNHIAYMALISQFEVKGVHITIVLDVVELPKASLDVSSRQAGAEHLELVTLRPEHGTGIQWDSRRIWNRT